VQRIAHHAGHCRSALDTFTQLQIARNSLGLNFRMDGVGGGMQNPFRVRISINIDRGDTST
jgi:hypothetical protein